MGILNTAKFISSKSVYLLGKMASSGGSRGSISSGVFYTQQHVNFNDLDKEDCYPEFIQYFQEPASASPNLDSISIPRMSARPSIASISNTLKRGKR